MEEKPINTVNQLISPYFDHPYPREYKLDYFDLLDELGEGSSGTVYKAKDNAYSGQFVALKKIDLYNTPGISYQEYETEYKIHQQLRHPNVVQLLGFFDTNLHGYIVMDFMDQDLEGYLRVKKQGLDFAEVKDVSKQILQGLGYCHAKGVMHRDLKCCNILRNNDGLVKIADFGLGRDFIQNPDANLTKPIQTLNYRAPEVIVGRRRYTFSVDVWSFSCIFAELITGKKLFKGYSEYSIFDQLIDFFGSPNEIDLPGFKDTFYGRYFRGRKPKTSLIEKIPKLSTNAQALQVLEATLKYNQYNRPTVVSLLNFDLFYLNDMQD